MTLLRNLKLEHWGWIHAKLAFLLWGFLYMFYTPNAPERELGTLLITMQSFFVIVGATTSIIGLLIATSQDVQRRYFGFRIELVGLVLAICGPIVYFVTQLYLTCNPPPGADSKERVALVAFAYLACALLTARLIVVSRFMRRRL